MKVRSLNAVFVMTTVALLSFSACKSVKPAESSNESGESSNGSSDIAVHIDLGKAISDSIESLEPLKENPSFTPYRNSLAYEYDFDKYKLVLESRCFSDIKSTGFRAEDREKLGTFSIKKIAEIIASKHVADKDSKPIIYSTGIDDFVFAKPGIMFAVLDNNQSVTRYAVDPNGDIFLLETSEDEQNTSKIAHVDVVKDAKDKSNIAFTPTEFYGFKLYQQPNAKNKISKLSATVASNIAYQQLEDKTEEWIFVLDGISHINDEDAFEFSIGTNGYRGFASKTRMAVTSTGNVYQYQQVPRIIGEFDTTAQPPEPNEKGTELLGFTDMHTNTFINYDYGTYIYHQPKPNFAFKGQNSDLLGANAIFQKVISTRNLSSGVIQRIKLDTDDFSLLSYIKPYINYEKTNTEITLIGVDKVDNKDALEYKVSIIDTDKFYYKYNLTVNLAVTEDGKVYDYTLTPKLLTKATDLTSEPQSLSSFKEKFKAEKSAHPDDFIQDTSKFVFSNHNYYINNNKEVVRKLPTLKRGKALEHIRPLIDGYKGELLPLPWYVYLTEYGNIEDEPAYIFDLGQGLEIDNENIIRKQFKAAITVSGKIYQYEGDTPKLVKTVTLPPPSPFAALDEEEEDF